jgi:DNA-binding NarL/FixJ family response regulator
MARAPVVAVFNSNDDVVEMLRFALEQAGMVVVSGHIDAIRRGGQRLSDFAGEHDPDVILYDLVPPYDRSWRFLEHVRRTATMTARRFVITSTNAARAREIIGNAEHIYEIVGRAHDLDAVVGAVESAARGRVDPMPPEARNV